jgi:hypothetical protein
LSASEVPVQLGHWVELNEEKGRAKVRYYDAELPDDVGEEIGNVALIEHAGGRTSVYEETFAVAHDEAGRLIASTTTGEAFHGPESDRAQQRVALCEYLGERALNVADSTLEFRAMMHETAQ